MSYMIAHHGLKQQFSDLNTHSRRKISDPFKLMPSQTSSLYINIRLETGFPKYAKLAM